MFRLTVLLVLLVLAVAVTGRADFVLSGNEHLEVNGAHDIGIMHNSSTAKVVSGGNVRNRIEINNEALLRIVAGQVGSLKLYDNSSVDTSGGKVSSILQAYNNSSVHISGDSVVMGLRIYGTNTVDISGGTVSSVYAWQGNNSTWTVSGGTIGSTQFRGNSTVEISGGIFGSVSASGDSTVTILGGELAGVTMDSTGTMDIFGGSIPSISAGGGSTTLHGYDFRASGGLSLEDEWVVGTGLLTGKWSDGTSWITTVSSDDPWATIRTVVVPEPSTLAMLLGGVLLGIACWKRRRG